MASSCARSKILVFIFTWSRNFFSFTASRRVFIWIIALIYLFPRSRKTKAIIMCLRQCSSIFILKIAQNLVCTKRWNVYTKIDQKLFLLLFIIRFYLPIYNLPFSILILNRSPIPKLGDRRPKVCGIV